MISAIMDCGTVLRCCAFLILACILIEGKNYSIVVFIPMTSSEYASGQAATLGISIALSELRYPILPNRTVINSKFGSAEVNFHDTKCNPQIEKKILREYINQGEPVVILGGGCLPSLTSPAGQSAFLSDLFPQITQETILGNGNQFKSIVQLRPSIFINLFSVVATFGVTTIGLISDNESSKMMYTLQQLGKANGVSLTVHYFVNQTRLYESMRRSQLSTFVVLVDTPALESFLCSPEILDTNRYQFFAIVSSNTISYLNSSSRSKQCLDSTRKSGVTFIIENEKDFYPTQEFSQRFSQEIGGLEAATVALSYDVTTLLITALLTADSISQIIPYITSRTWQGASGEIAFEENIRRNSPTTWQLGKSVNSNKIEMEIKSGNPPLWLFILMTLLGLLGEIYAIIILAFNICYRKNRIIKLTSPNMNAIMCIGAMLIFVSVPLHGLMSVTNNIIAIQLAKSIIFCLIPTCVTTMFIIIAVKSWRLYNIFSRLSNRRTGIKDGRLVQYSTIGCLIVAIVFILVVVFDPITCQDTLIWTEYQETTRRDVYHLSKSCRNTYWTGWLCLQVSLQVPTAAVTLLFAWRIRHITIPALCDTQAIYASVFIASLVVPLLYPALIRTGSSTADPTVLRFSLQSVLMIIVPVFILTVYLLPKIILVIHNQRADDQVAVALDQTRVTESLRNTRMVEAQEPRLCCLSSGSNSSVFASTGSEAGNRQRVRDATGVDQEFLQIEMQNLKRTIKEKDITIRELTDRLFYGYGKYQEGCAEDWSDTRTTNDRLTDINEANHNSSDNNNPLTHSDCSNNNNMTGLSEIIARNASPDSALGNTVSGSETGFEVQFGRQHMNTTSTLHSGNTKQLVRSPHDIQSNTFLTVLTDKESRV